jgi:hypothetical protein
MVKKKDFSLTLEMTYFFDFLRDCQSWKTEGKAFGPSESPLRSAYLARLLFLQSEEFYKNNRLNFLF